MYSSELRERVCASLSIHICLEALLDSYGASQLAALSRKLTDECKRVAPGRFNEQLNEFDVVLHDAADFSFGVPDEGELLITTSGDGLMPSGCEGSAGLPNFR